MEYIFNYNDVDKVFNYNDVDKVFNLIMILLGFYVLYAVQNVFDSTFYGLGKTNYMLFESIVTNIVYYGICFVLYISNVFKPTPVGIALIEQGGFSFPSGHSMVSLAFYGYIIYLMRKSKLSKVQKNIATIILSMIIILVGISRIYLGVHFASDVLAAYCLSTAFLVIIMYIERKKKNI